MNVTFVGATKRQRELWLTALHNLIGLPFEKIPLTTTVEFVDPSELVGHGHTDLAQTFADYDSTDSTIKVRNDAPEFAGADKSLEALAAQMGLKYSAELHFHETAVHETGHAYFAALTEDLRLKVMAMFGLKTDDPDVVYDPDKVWQNRVGEGMAETFKEAYLPRRFRVFPNRTNRRISYKDFPAFRDLFRVSDGFSYLYGSSSFRVHLEECIGGIPLHRSNRDPEACVLFEEIDGYESGWGVNMGQFKEAGKLPFSIEEEGIITS